MLIVLEFASKLVKLDYLSPGWMMKELTRTCSIAFVSLAIKVMLWSWTEISIGHNVNPGEMIRNRYLYPEVTWNVARGVGKFSSNRPFPLTSMLSALFLPVSQWWRTNDSLVD